MKTKKKQMMMKQKKKKKKKFKEEEWGRGEGGARTGIILCCKFLSKENKGKEKKLGDANYVTARLVVLRDVTSLIVRLAAKLLISLRNDHRENKLSFNKYR